MLAAAHQIIAGATVEPVDIACGVTRLGKIEPAHDRILNREQRLVIGALAAEYQIMTGAAAGRVRSRTTGEIVIGAAALQQVGSGEPVKRIGITIASEIVANRTAFEDTAKIAVGGRTVVILHLIRIEADGRGGPAVSTLAAVFAPVGKRIGLVAGAAQARDRDIGRWRSGIDHVAEADAKGIGVPVAKHHAIAQQESSIVTEFPPAVVAIRSTPLSR